MPPNQPDELLDAKELAKALKRSVSYVYAMRRKGFVMVGQRTTLGQALLWLQEHPHPCKRVLLIKNDAR